VDGVDDSVAGGFGVVVVVCGEVAFCDFLGVFDRF
jgi:hypothetical protein